MGEVKDLLISGSNSEELREMVDNARDQHNEGYIQFLEEQLEKAETLISRIKDMTDDEIEVSIQESMVSSFIDNYYNDKK
jgi:hypothetical protein